MQAGIAEEVESGIVERGYGMEGRQTNGLPEIIFRNQSDEIDDHSEGFDNERSQDDRPDKFDHSGYRMLIQSFLDYVSFGDADLNAKKNQNVDGDRHNTESADLDQNRQHDFSENGKCGGEIRDGGKAGNTDR